MDLEFHPVYAEPTAADCQSVAELKEIRPADAYKLLVQKRAEKIQNETSNPLLYGYEPSIWRVCDALLGLDWVIPQRFGEDYGPRMRAALGFSAPVNTLLLDDESGFGDVIVPEPDLGRYDAVTENDSGPSEQGDTHGNE